MTYPTKHVLTYSYTAFQQSQGNNDFPGTQIDTDLINLKATIDETVDFLSFSFNANGRLKSGSVTLDALAFEIRDRFTAEMIALVDAEASLISVVPAGNITGTNVQDALEELDTLKASADHEHSASQIPISAITNLTGGNVQDALAFLRALGPQTGDVHLTIATTAPAGWVMCDDGTISKTGAGGTTRANDDCLALFTMLWTNVSDTYAPVSTGRGLSANADWLAGKTIGLTKMLGRALALSGAGSGLTARTLGQTFGAETHALSAAEGPVHSHGITDPGHTTQIKYNELNGGSAGTTGVRHDDGAFPNTGSVTKNSIAATTGITVNDAGNGVAHNNMQPTSFLNARIKL